jgi:hypothetical protein
MASLVLWLASVIVWVALLAVDAAFGCPEFTPGSSDYGQTSWEWLPPGNKCVYDVSQRYVSYDGPEVHTDDPPFARYGILGLLILWPAATAAVVYASRRDYSEAECASRGSELTN